MKNLTFEQAMKRLEEIVNLLEGNEIPLEQSIDLFQEGIELSKLCHTKITSIEERVTKILVDGKLEDFTNKEI